MTVVNVRSMVLGRSEMVKLKCKKCGWVWDYGGRKEYYATCPNCRRAVNIKKERINNGDEEEIHN